MQQLIFDLLAANIGDFRTNERLAPYTTWKIGLVEARQGGGTYVKKPVLEPLAVLESLQNSNAELSLE
jgi:DNA-binding FadR family transcriptional regulator